MQIFSFSQIGQPEMSIVVKNCISFWWKNSKVAEIRPKNETFQKIPPLQFPKRPTTSSKDNIDNNRVPSLEDDNDPKQDSLDQIDSIDADIVEGIPGNAFSVEDSDPETRCQNTCGQNEICQINARQGIECKCRPGFGRPSDRSKCESKQNNTHTVWKLQNFSVTQNFT